MAVMMVCEMVGQWDPEMVEKKADLMVGAMVGQSAVFLVDQLVD